MYSSLSSSCFFLPYHVLFSFAKRKTAKCILNNLHFSKRESFIGIGGGMRGGDGRWMGQMELHDCSFCFVSWQTNRAKQIRHFSGDVKCVHLNWHKMEFIRNKQTTEWTKNYNEMLNGCVKMLINAISWFQKGRKKTQRKTKLAMAIYTIGWRFIC